MIFPLTRLRQLLVLVAALTASFLTVIPSYSSYICLLLIYVLIIQVRAQVSHYSAALLLLFAEIAWSFWMCAQYGGLMYLLFLSALVSLFTGSLVQFRMPAAISLFLIMNAAIYAGWLKDADTVAVNNVLTANTIYCISALLLFRSSAMEVSREELRQLYDEHRKKHYELEEVRKQLVEYALMVESSAQVEERNRIAHDIHDDLGHKLIRLKMMLEAVIHIMPDQPDKSLELVTQVRDQLSDSMETMRKTVRRLRPGEDEVQHYSLDRLMEELAREPGFRMHYQTHGLPFPLYPSCEIVLYRNAQEAVTNAIRHGQATSIEVHLHYDEKELRMTVSNNGSLPPDLNRKGLGLSGMEERSRLLGGSIYYETSPHFSITTRIPLVRP